MYNAQLTADRIKEQAKAKKIQLEQLQKIVGLSKNAIQTSSKSKNGLGAAYIYCLSKELDCSADFLLGLVDENVHCNEQSAHSTKSDATEINHDRLSSELTSDDISEIASMYKRLSLVDKAQIVVMMHKMLERKS